MQKREKRTILRIILSALICAAGLLLPLDERYALYIFLPAYLIVGADVLYAAARNILRGQVFDENFLMSIAAVGAFATGEYPEGVMVMLLYQLGELFQSYAVGRSRKSIAALMDIRPDYANIQRDGQLVQVDPYDVHIGDLIVVKSGERIPLDGMVTEGSALVDTSALTGESVPRELAVGSDALSGCINLNGLLTIRVSKEFGESTVSKVLELVETASSKKARSENFITKFARYYTPAVVAAAVLLAVVPPLLIPGALFSDWLYRALTFLVISCPCALVISVPLGFFSGIGCASKCGILVKGSNYLEVLSLTDTVVFDKTGTLTKGTFTVTELHPDGISQEALLEYAALAESYSDHPISQSIKRAYQIPINNQLVRDVREIAGQGVQAVVSGVPVFVGNARLMQSSGIPCATDTPAGTIVHVAVGGQYAGYLVIADEIKADAKRAIALLKQQSNVKKTIMLTGDVRAVADAVGKELGIDEVYAQLLPGDKVDKLEELLAQKNPRATLAFVGDGINDAPVLARADVGIAMGGMGSDAAIEAADIVIMDDEPSKISVAISIARKTLRIVKQNIVFALGIKAIVLLLGAFGIATMWAAVFADVGVSFIAILNAMRALRVTAKKI